VQAVEYIAENNIMHRDLKPDNILFSATKQSHLNIIDFGLATLESNFLYLFVKCGTPGYVAPEICNIKDWKKGHSSICDIFSVGAIFYFFYYILINIHKIKIDRK